MLKDDIFIAIGNALTQIQVDSGRVAPSIKLDTKPIGDLEEFDSHCGIEFNCAIEQLLNIEVPLDENLCVNDDASRARTVEEIVERIIELNKDA